MSSALERGFLTTGPLGKSPVPSSFHSPNNLLLSFFLKLLFCLFIIGCLGLCCCMGFSAVAVHRLLIVVVFLVSELRF